MGEVSFQLSVDTCRAAIMGAVPTPEPGSHTKPELPYPGNVAPPHSRRDSLLDAALVAAGGGTGALARHLMMVGVPDAPLALWSINVVGSLLLGVVTGAALPRRARLTLGTGLLGSFTSYSALAAFTAGGALVSALLSVVAGVLVAAAGLAVGARARSGGVPCVPQYGEPHPVPPTAPKDGRPAAPPDVLARDGEAR